MSQDKQRSPLLQRWHKLLEHVEEICVREGRDGSAVKLLAVSKRHPVSAIEELAEAGQRMFGENYLQEALPKIEALARHSIEWHFIGRIQSNKTRAIAANFDWVHTLDRSRIAKRLSEQRPPERGPLNVLIEVNLDNEASKGGVLPDALSDLADEIARLPALRLRGLMALPAPVAEYERQLAAFENLACLARAQGKRGHEMDCLSMGTTADMDAAIAAGSTIVRIGTRLFGPRD